MKVGYSEQALRDIEDIATFLQARNPRAAERVGAAIRRTIDRLDAYPESGRRQDDPDGIRKLVVPGFGYLIFYRIENDAELMILTILHPARDRPYADR